MNPEAPANEQKGRRLRWVCALAIIIATLFSMRAVFFVPKFDQIYRDMLSSGDPVPSAVGWLMRNYPYVQGLLLMLSGLAMGIIFKGSRLALAKAATILAVLVHAATGVWIAGAVIRPLIPVIQRLS